MPPRNVRTIRDLIYWEYAKLIAGSAVGDRKNFGFVMYTFNQLKNKQLHPSAILRENQKLVKEASDICSYCGCHDRQELQWEHIIPKSRGGPDTIDNMVLCCKKCNLSKSDKDPF
jgi:CRISPR/Cas system Type II protein with McrA/HNH and RuvC-like nuclease domain